MQEALATLMRGRTTIVIAHRLSTIQEVDRIAVMHRGRLAEVGSHAELLQGGGLYRRLYESYYATPKDQGKLEMKGEDGHPAAP